MIQPFFLIITYLISLTSERYPCDTKLLNTFKLRGLKYSARSPMNICPMVHDKCCTVMDELAVLRLWNQHAKPATALYSQQYFRALSSLVKYMNQLTEQLNENDIVVHYAKHKWIPYLKNTCLYKYYPRESNEDVEIGRKDEFVAGEGNVHILNDESFLHLDPMQDIMIDKLDKESVNLYLALIAKTASIDKKYFPILENLYFDEYDLTTIDITKIIFPTLDLVKEKKEFLAFIDLLNMSIFKTYKNIMEKYKSKISEQKLN